MKITTTATPIQNTTSMMSMTKYLLASAKPSPFAFFALVTPIIEVIAVGTGAKRINAPMRTPPTPPAASRINNIANTHGTLMRDFFQAL